MMADIDYEEMRKKNIAERKAEFAAFFKELKTETGELKKTITPRKKTRRYSSEEDEENRPPKKKRYSYRNYRLERSITYNTRSRSRRTSEIDYDEAEAKEDDIDRRPTERLLPKGSRLKVIFPWAKTFEREMEMASIDKWDVDKELAEYNEETSDDSDDVSIKPKKDVPRFSKSVYDPSTIPSPDEITDAMLSNVAEKSSGKTYCKFKGTSCHQCRQKTMDTKTVCRSGECIGVRGQFCGPCLRGRYGEDAVTVLKDPNWACPPCRGLCNCSICRTRNGRRPTGILAPVAQEEGFSSVMDYLRATSGDEEETVDSSN